MHRDDDIRAEVLELLVIGLSPVEALQPSSKNQFLAKIAGSERFLPFLDRVATMFDLGEPEARRQLGTIGQDDEWDDMLPGIRFRDFEGGPALGDAHGGLVRVLPGAAFPHHRHVGEERMLLLQGKIRDDQGKEYRAGDLIVSPDGTQHEFEVVGDREVIYAAAVVALEFTATDDEDDWDDED